MIIVFVAVRAVVITSLVIVAFDDPHRWRLPCGIGYRAPRSVRVTRCQQTRSPRKEGEGPPQPHPTTTARLPPGPGGASHHHLPPLPPPACGAEARNYYKGVPARGLSPATATDDRDSDGRSLFTRAYPEDGVPAGPTANTINYARGHRRLQAWPARGEPVPPKPMMSTSARGATRALCATAAAARPGRGRRATARTRTSRSIDPPETTSLTTKSARRGRSTKETGPGHLAPG